MAAKAQPKEIAFYYPEPIWHGSDWIKTLILFFDGVGILLPNYIKGKLEHEDPATATPLMDKGFVGEVEGERAGAGHRGWKVDPDASKPHSHPESSTKDSSGGATTSSSRARAARASTSADTSAAKTRAVLQSQ